ncbi:MAG: methylmalonyl-CoA mutase family protein, partial [Bdellovibrionota bacterium]
KWNHISISGYHIREAGSNAPQELAFTFGDAIAYVESALANGLKIDAFAGQLSFFFSVHNEFFEEIAKFRAARRIWAKIMRDRFGARDPRSQMLRFHCQTAGSTLTAQQPETNAIRVAYQAMAAVLGGTQSLHTNSRDEALGLPTEASATLALRTQQVLAYETGVASTVDPLAGSVYVEALTDEIEKRTLDILTDIDSRGGMVRCIESGVIQSWILNSAFLDQRKIDSGEIPVVGVNLFKSDPAGPAGKSAKALRVSPAQERDAIARVRAYRSKRSNAKLQASLIALNETATNGKASLNLMDTIIDAIRAPATLGEISDALRAVYGEYTGYRGIG